MKIQTFNPNINSKFKKDKTKSRRGDCTWKRRQRTDPTLKSYFQKFILKGADSISFAKVFRIWPKSVILFVKNYLPELLQVLKQNKKKNHILRMIKAWKRLNAAGYIKPTKGKTYKEIYGTSTPGCGFQKGLKNPNFTCQKFRGKSIINKLGEKYRSSYEVEFSELLHDHFIPFEYEHRFKLLNNQCKVVDFIVGDLLIEVTGYAYEKWRQDFDVKIQLLHQTYPDKKILLCSRNDKRPIIDDLRKHENEKITVLNLDDPQSIIAYIKANS